MGSTKDTADLVDVSAPGSLPFVDFDISDFAGLIQATEALDMGVTEAIIANGQRENPISSAIAHNHCTVIKDE